MYTPTDVQTRVEKALEKALALEIYDSPHKDPQSVMISCLEEFNKWFEGVYHFDSIRLPKELIRKDSGLYEGEEIHA
ncbi:MAG: hypothetical protein ACRYGG_07655 [Janthinobacterium lividum]